MKRLVAESDTVLFLIGFGILIAGVAQVSTPAAFILAGLVLCAVAILLASARRSNES